MTSSCRMSAPLVCLVIAALAFKTSSGRQLAERCPVDVQAATRHCLEDHNGHLHAIQQTETHFFGGIDVEDIRTLCHEFKTKSIQCVTAIIRACPDSRRHEFDVALRPYGALINMCYHKHFIEEYAIIQNCLYSQRDASDVCYSRFLTNTASYGDLAWQQNHHSAVLSYCRSLSQLTSCVQTATVPLCGISDKTDRLVSLLVSVSVNLSFKCPQNSSTSLTTSSSRTNHRPSGAGQAVSNQKRTVSAGSEPNSLPYLRLLALLLAAHLTAFLFVSR